MTKNDVIIMNNNDLEKCKNHFEFRKNVLDVKQQNSQFYIRFVKLINSDVNLYECEYLLNDVFVSGKFFAPTQLNTRLQNIENLEKQVIYIKCLGTKKSNKNRDMIAYYVEIL